MEMKSDSDSMEECHVFFGVFDFGDDIDRVTQIMGIEPTESWLKGERYGPDSRGRRTHSRWVFESGLEQADTIENHLNAILTILEQRPQGVATCTELFRTVIWIAIYFGETRPVFTIAPELARRLADMGVSMDVDIYYVSDKPE